MSGQMDRINANIERAEAQQGYTDYQLKKRDKRIAELEARIERMESFLFDETKNA